jgi:thiamine biosynthesis protein ThiS
MPLHVTINGDSRQFDGPTSVAAMLSQLGFEPLRVAVERNRALVRRRDFDHTTLADGDSLEIVTLVGGG